MTGDPFDLTLTVVVITLDEQPGIARVLRRITEDSGLETLEVVVVDGGSTDRTAEIASRYAAVLLSPPGRAGQMARGLQETSGDVVLFCHGDTLLPEDFGVDILQACADPAVVGGSFRPVYRPAHPVLTALSVVLRIPTPLLIFGDQAMFARRKTLSAVGGVPRLSLMEDVALALALARNGKLVRIKQQAVTSSRRFLERGPLHQLLLDIRLLFRYHVLRQDPDLLAPLYQVSSREEGLAGEEIQAGLGVMAKAPLPGHAKTRLGKELGPERAAEIYGSILDALLTRFTGLGEDVQRVVFAAGEEDSSWFEDHYPEWEVRVQEGGDLGERLRHAAESLFAGGADRVFLAAGDVPGFHPRHFHQAIRGLEGHDLVFGPSPDGGYYLIGMNQLHHPVLKGIPWGGPGVLEASLAKAQAAGLVTHLLTALPDIDTRTDWERYQQLRDQGE